MILEYIRQWRFNKTFDAWLSSRYKYPGFLALTHAELILDAHRLESWSKSRLNNKNVLIGALARYISKLHSSEVQCVEDIIYLFLNENDAGLVLLEYLRIQNPIMFNLVLMSALGADTLLKRQAFTHLNCNIIDLWIHNVFKHGIAEQHLPFLSRLAYLMKQQPVIDILNYKWNNNATIIKEHSLVARYIYVHTDRPIIEREWVSRPYQERLLLLEHRIVAIGFEVENINPYSTARKIYPEHITYIDIAEIHNKNPYVFIRDMLKIPDNTSGVPLPVLT